MAIAARANMTRKSSMIVALIIATMRMFVSVDADLTLNLLTKSVQSHGARCLDGSPPAYYWRPGSKSDSFVFFFEGGGWCFPNNPNFDTGDNCLIRSSGSTGTSKNYKPVVTEAEIEGGKGMLSGNANLTAFADWNVIYVKYCDGGSFTGNMADPHPINGTDIYYRGHHNLQAVLDDLDAKHGMKAAKEVVVSGCSAGGMSCYLHCEALTDRLAPAKVSCVCDAGVFLDIPSAVVPGNNFMEDRFFDVYTSMNSSIGLSQECQEKESDPRRCIFSQMGLKYMRPEIPVFSINSLYNFMVWDELTITAWNYTVPDDWMSCTPSISYPSTATWPHCNDTQRTIIQQYRETFIDAMAPAVDPKNNNGAFWDPCPGNHCQTSGAWNTVYMMWNGKNITLNDAVAEWYFHSATVKLIGDPYPSNPTC